MTLKCIEAFLTSCPLEKGGHIHLFNKKFETGKEAFRKTSDVSKCRYLRAWLIHRKKGITVANGEKQLKFTRRKQSTVGTMGDELNEILNHIFNRVNKLENQKSRLY